MMQVCFNFFSKKNDSGHRRDQEKRLIHKQTKIKYRK
jgi:hypothetical protein